MTYILIDSLCLLLYTDSWGTTVAEVTPSDVDLVPDESRGSAEKVNSRCIFHVHLRGFGEIETCWHWGWAIEEMQEHAGGAELEPQDHEFWFEQEWRQFLIRCCGVAYPYIITRIRQPSNFKIGNSWDLSSLYQHRVKIIQNKFYIWNNVKI